MCILALSLTLINFLLDNSTQFTNIYMQLPCLECRPLCHGDNAAVRALCAECFPISYPNSWFDYITSNKASSTHIGTIVMLSYVFCSEQLFLTPQVYSQGAFTRHGTLVGMLVAEFQPLAQVEGEAGALLECATADTTAVYIISLGECNSDRTLQNLPSFSHHGIPRGSQ